MAKGKKSPRAGASYKAQYGAYPHRYAKNRRRRINKHLARHPSDKKAEKALENADKYRRRTPRTKGGWIPTEWIRSLGLEHKHPINSVGPSEKRKVAQDIRFARKTANMVKYGQFKVDSEEGKTNYEFEKEHVASLMGNPSDAG